MTQLNKHPILCDLYNLVQRMETEFPASTLETDCCLKAAELVAMLDALQNATPEDATLLLRDVPALLTKLRAR